MRQHPPLPDAPAQNGDESLQHCLLSLEPTDNHRLAQLCGQDDQHLRQIESALELRILRRGNRLNLRGQVDSVRRARTLIHRLYDSESSTDSELTAEQIHLQLADITGDEPVPDSTPQPPAPSNTTLRLRRRRIAPRGARQRHYVECIRNGGLCLGLGPAGTGKSYLAVACAVEALEQERVQRIVLVRPAIEAGERLGFLPGDLRQKTDPYLRPLYDALHEALGSERLQRELDNGVIEVAPLAYMRGRTLSQSFAILDEAQNTTVAQMKMFLTRLGFGSTAVVNGDLSQVDLPLGTRSGLRDALDRLTAIEGVSLSYFQRADIMRHPLVQRIVEAYEQAPATASNKA